MATPSRGTVSQGVASNNQAASKKDTKKSGTVLNSRPWTRHKGRDDEDLAGVILTWFVQVTGLAAAVTFGIFSVLSWTSAQDAKQQAHTAIQQADTANQQANAANLLALAALCGNTAVQNTTFNNEVRKFCSQLFPYAWTPLASAASNIFPDIGPVTPPTAPSGTPSTSAVPTSGSAAGGIGNLATGAQVGLGVGITVGFVVLFITLLTFVRRRRMRHSERND